MVKRRRWEVINELIEKHDVKSFIEIGVLRGENASHILKKNPQLHYIGVDPYVGGEDGVEYDHTNNMSEAIKIFRLYDNAVLLRHYSTELASMLASNVTRYDMIFIDGDHSYKAVKQDIQYWKPLVKPGGILAGHDYSKHPSKAGVIKAVNEKIPEDKLNLSDDNVWYYIKDA